MFTLEPSPREPTLPGVYLLRSLDTPYPFPIRPIRSYIDGPLRTLQGPPPGSHLSVLSTTRSFLSSVAVPVVPFELQPAPSMLQHKLPIPNPP
ncbi:hypothetical protein F5876DRAFT_85252 [Lentinula aff. lateritia]|uniref:Uncharacterized protein n=1 Tax=Lentinula aff. lateritia TaxID=2804960 RepID=A0ACC1TFI0_9AGAR|nr:hypothetical protein F5876DRAFT_85252 [Lentinula aff. lateritia]